MLLANKQVAMEIGMVKGKKQPKPFVYRIHDNPDPDKMLNFSTIAHRFGYKVKIKGKRSAMKNSLNKMLSQGNGRPEENLLSSLAIRSIAKAVYSTVNVGHYGLAFDYYTHFTSPIRRYPDLQIQRIIKDDLRGRLDKGGRIGKYSSILQHVGEQSSAMEQRATEAEREAVKLKKAEYMLEHVGEEYDGVISGVTGWGFYVELQNTVEGLVHIMTLKDDYYNFDEENYRLVGEQHGRVFRLGEPVRVRVRNAEPANRTIDFTYVEKETETE